jgi:hypothetical protein
MANLFPRPQVRAVDAQTLDLLSHRKMIGWATEDLIEFIQDLTRGISALKQKPSRIFTGGSGYTSGVDQRDLTRTSASSVDGSEGRR